MISRLRHIKDEIHIFLWALVRKTPKFVQYEAVGNYLYAVEVVAAWEGIQEKLSEARVLTSDINAAIIHEIELGQQQVHACLRYFDYFGVDYESLITEE